MTPNAHFEDSILNHTRAPDFSQYPAPWNLEASTILDEPTDHFGGRTLSSGHGSPTSRNVSQPQLVSSTNCMRESWFANFGSAHTAGDVGGLTNDDAICADASSGGNATTQDSRVHSFYDNGNKTAPRLPPKDSCDDFGNIEARNYRSDDSLYSMHSADQDAHPLLLSMPIIPQIKLERKATVRCPDPVPFSDATQNGAFLSPRIQTLRTPAKGSSRRYGRAPQGPSAPTIVSNSPLSKKHGGEAHQMFRRYGLAGRSNRAEGRITRPTYKRSTSDSTLSSPYTSDDERELLMRGIGESCHSDVLLSMIDEVAPPQVLLSESAELGIDKVPGRNQDPPEHAKRNNQRASLGHSISFNSIVHAVADGCASLDHLLRRPKPKPWSTTSPEPSRNTNGPASKWDPRQGLIIIKVFVPSTDDIWMFRVPEDINLVDFTSIVVTKLGFAVSFSGSVWDESKYYFRTDAKFKSWVKGRIRFGRNLPIVAHVLAPVPLVKLSVDTDGCEVWCYA